MDFKTILVDLGEDSDRGARIEAAARLAMAAGGSIVGLTATGTQLEPFRGAGEEAGRYAELAAGQLHRLVVEDEAALENGVRKVSPAIHTRHVVIEAEAGWALATHGRFADIILPRPPSADTNVPAPLACVAEYAMLNAGRPILLVRGPVSLQLPGRATIAWNGSREAARAVADALPWLASASAVSILVITSGEEKPAGEGGADHDSGQRLAAWLANHGINADLRVVQGDPDEMLPQIASALQSDLLVAGGYGRPRLRELVLGGTTRVLLHQYDFPVFMSH